LIRPDLGSDAKIFPSGVLAEVGGSRAVQVLDRGVQRPQDGHEGQDRVAQRLGEDLAGCPGRAVRSRSSSWAAGRRPE
jgi:hypothetical protein